MTQRPHIPVMLNEVLAAMQPADGEIYVDGTFGAGGYSEALLGAAACRVYAIDRDPSVAVMAEKLKDQFPDRFCLITGSFGDMVELLQSQGVQSVNGVVLDLGVSSMQIDTPERGFSFRFDGPLDMRMSDNGVSASDIVNTYGEKELADILYYYGEERLSRRIAKAIVTNRAEKPITRTTELANIIRAVVHKGADKIDPATRSFQALRIAVNDELDEITRGLEAAQQLLAPNGRLIVVTFHSLEDRLVKAFYKSRSGDTRGGSRHMPMLGETHANAHVAPPAFFARTRKAVLPDSTETARNPRSRSAKLRVAVRTDAPHHAGALP